MVCSFWRVIGYIFHTDFTTLTVTGFLIGNVLIDKVKMFSPEEQQLKICLLKSDLEEIGDDLSVHVSPSQYHYELVNMLQLYDNDTTYAGTYYFFL